MPLKRFLRIRSLAEVMKVILGVVVVVRPPCLPLLLVPVLQPGGQEGLRSDLLETSPSSD